jgi:hypothetical protein
MVLEARFKRGWATHNRLTPLIPSRGIMPPTIAMNTVKGIGPH